LLDPCNPGVAHELAYSPFDADLKRGISLFLDQLTRSSQAQEDTPVPTPDPKVSNASNQGEAGSEMGMSETRHGHVLKQRGFAVELVVREYIDFCQEIAGLGTVVIFNDRPLPGLPR